MKQRNEEEHKNIKKEEVDANTPNVQNGDSSDPPLRVILFKEEDPDMKTESPIYPIKMGIATIGSLGLGYGNPSASSEMNSVPYVATTVLPPQHASLEKGKKISKDIDLKRPIPGALMARPHLGGGTRMAFDFDNHVEEVNEKIKDDQSLPRSCITQGDFSSVENTQPKKKRKVSQDNNNKVTMGKGKVGTATAMRKSSERLVEAAEIHNEAKKEETAAIFHDQYSIPECIRVLISLKEKGRLDQRQFIYALELLKDDHNRVILMSLTDSIDSLVDWILFKY
ncbi:uncharacterized protein LOC130714557 [Lotus japonicus]|uniref:uncharacterized protein LOC130714557 n=1 Tax=Lotus japonicus TaxID=34305 RepID=UPI00258E809E|nr:uncharacterized protein LOC130714557 [Lotus japonicus]